MKLSDITNMPDLKDNDGNIIESDSIQQLRSAIKYMAENGAGSGGSGGGGANNQIAKVDVSSNVSEIQFTGLDLLTDGGYIILLNLIPTVNQQINIYVNGDMVNANYTETYLYNTETASHNSGIKSDSQIAHAIQGQNTCAEINVRLVGNRVLFNSISQRTDGNTYRFNGEATNTVSNVTQIDIVSSVDGGIGTGSTIRLFRLIGLAQNGADWSSIVNKPATYPPNSHSHVKSDVTDFPHTHVKSEITDLTTGVTGVKVTGQNSITGNVILKPGTNITMTQDDVNKEITINSSGGGGATSGQITWTPVPLSNGWQNWGTSSFPGLQVYLDLNGFVHIEGMLKAGTSTTIGTIPAGFRPAVTENIVAVAWNSTAGAQQYNRAGITSSGTITLDGPTTAGVGATGWLFITGTYPEASGTFTGGVGGGGGTWQTPTLLNGWVNYGSGTTAAAYMKDAVGFVHIKGAIKSGTVTAGTTIFTLPAGYRPLEEWSFPQVSNDLVTRVKVQANGNVVTSTPTPSNAWLLIDGIVFKAEQ